MYLPLLLTKGCNVMPSLLMLAITTLCSSYKLGVNTSILWIGAIVFHNANLRHAMLFHYVCVRYVVEWMDVADLYEKLPHSGYEFWRQLIDQVKSTTPPKSKSPVQFSTAMKVCMIPNLPKSWLSSSKMLYNSAFGWNFNLSFLLILTALTAVPSRVMKKKTMWCCCWLPKQTVDKHGMKFFSSALKMKKST